MFYFFQKSLKHFSKKNRNLNISYFYTIYYNFLFQRQLCDKILLSVSQAIQTKAKYINLMYIIAYCVCVCMCVYYKYNRPGFSYIMFSQPWKNIIYLSIPGLFHFTFLSEAFLFITIGYIFINVTSTPSVQITSNVVG